MAESVPPPPPTKSGGSFIAVALLMLVAAGGLIYWKMSGDKEEAPKPPPPAPVAQAPAPRIEVAIPPPPPVDAGTDAEAKVATKTPVKGGGGGGACAGECKGSVTPALSSALGGRAASARRCYERMLRTDSTLSGSVTAQVRVGPQGQVCGVSISKDFGGVGASCVAPALRAGNLPPPNGGCVDVAVPVTFKPSG